MSKIKKFICIVFAALLISDILSYVKYAYEHEFKVKTIYGFFTSMGHGVILNLSIIYFAAVCIIYFILNFFKKSKE